MGTNLFEAFLEKTFYKGFAGQDNLFSILELYINGECDQKCKYCYITKNRELYFPPGTENPVDIMNNVEILSRWLNKKGFTDVQLALFGAEILSQKLGKDILKYFINNPSITTIVVPSNMNFVFDNEDEIQSILDLAKSYNKRVHISASVDGKFVEDNRPIQSGRKKDDAYYDKLFSFCRRNRIWFHPMIYNEGIENWYDNFYWFQEMFKKYDMPSSSLFFLEVRNSGWTEKQCLEFANFMEFLIDWTCDNREITPENMFSELFNISMAPLVETSRGIWCSIQSTLMLRAGDLAVFPCHRTTYSDFMTAKLNKDTLTFDDIQPELGIGIYGANNKIFPVCERCVINQLCLGGCMGSQYETMGDMFAPIPDVCRLQHYKTVSILRALKRRGLLGREVLEKINTNKLNQIKLLEKEGYI